MNDIELLDSLIEIFANGNQSEFARITDIKESTIKTWRRADSIPDDKKLLLNTLYENYELKKEIADYKEYFRLQSKFMEKFQN